MKLIPEYEAFKRITDGLAIAKDGAILMSQHRPDQRDKWLKMAQVYEVSISALWKLAEESALEE